MAIDNQFGKGIGVAAGFDLGAQKPLDSRVAVNTIAERDAHVTENRAYEGMLVYVADENKTYQLVKGEEEGQLVWKEFGFNQADFEESFADSIQDVDNRLKDAEAFVAAQPAIDAEQDRRLGVLEGLISGGEGDDNALTQLQNAIDDVQDAADAAQADVDAIEGRLDNEGGLVDRLEAVEEFKQGHSHEALQGEIDAAEGRLDALEAFEEAHDHSVMEQGIADNKAAIAKLNGTAEEAGSVAKQIKDAVDPVQGEVDAVEGRVATLEADAPVKQVAIEAAQAAANKAQGEVDAVELRVDAVEEFVEGHSHEGLQGEIDAVELRVDALEAFKNGHSHATMEQGIADNKAAIEKEVDDREAAVEAVQGEIDALEAVVGKAKEGEQPAAGLFLAMEQADATNLQAAKDYADQQITALVDSAPDAMNTLNELASAINNNKGIYDAWVVEHNQAMAQQKSDLQAEIDADVKVVADELAKQKDAAQEGTLAKKIADEVARADAEEKAIRKLVADEKLALQGEIDADVKVEKERAEAEEAKIRGEFAAADTALHTTISAEIDADVKVEKERAEGQEAAIRQELANEKAALQKEIDDDVKVVTDALANEKDATKDGSLAKKIADEVSARSQADQDLQAAIDALELAVNGGEGEDKSVTARVADLEAFVETHDHTEMEGEIDALQAFVEGHSHSTMESDIAANKAAIEAEVGKEGVQGARDAAIAAALEAYSTTEEVKTILGNVVSTLNVSMVGDKMVLKLGGAEGITLSETSLDMVTDADIKAIIDGLDAE